VKKKRKPAYAALFVLGLGLMAIALSVNIAFIGAGAVFFIIGAAGMAKERRADRDSDEPNDK
jgi:hypothetical protein